MYICFLVRVVTGRRSDTCQRDRNCVITRADAIHAMGECTMVRRWQVACDNPLHNLPGEVPCTLSRVVHKKQFQKIGYYGVWAHLGSWLDYGREEGINSKILHKKFYPSETDAAEFLRGHGVLDID